MTDKEVKSQLCEGKAGQSWSGLFDADKSEILSKLDAQSQVELWAQIDKIDEKVKFITDNLADRDMRNNFWSKMSH